MDVTSKSVTYQPICDIAIITCAPTTFKYAITQQVLGTAKSKQEDIAKKVGAIVAVNGFGFNNIHLVQILELSRLCAGDIADTSSL